MPNDSARSRRRGAQRLGLKAETWAAWWLRLKGYRILARRFRAAPGEIDLVARRGRVLALVEVKARADLAQAAASVTPRQRHRIAGAAGVLLQRRPDLAGLDLRFDALLVAPGRLPRHIENAWRTGESH